MRVLICLLLLLSALPADADEPKVIKERTSYILNMVDDLWRGESSFAVVTMRVKTEHYTRTMRMEGWSKGKEKTLFRVLEPLREKGTMTLKSENHIYTYLPKTDRTIRLTSGMMMGSWMGSHLTNDDLVKEARLEEDYDALISFEGERDGRNIIEFTLTPKPDAPVVWGKLQLIIMAESYTPLLEYYYDEDMELARTFTFSGMKMLGGMERPAVLRVIPADKPDEYTEFIYEQLELDIPVSDEMFSISSLKRR
ncbi:outer membrane lipoprotein-sorting protein [Mariprofundus ferrinatatus]|uniref:Outer membrane lipoprotein-sorting protein n=1 Tax=Mariprofundus ferrinatatus TaxID=1921087 RepID=A0A2K8L3E9_9PROT|nr:outer membrane lipoprotein-sorting protein [Mariprofundus ferrinatatus]ATX81858.1 outer membrane lipoprotein-sorting protein [Mariprofundus ferrinatatus]